MTTIEELAQLLTIRNQELTNAKSIIEQYRSELQSLGKTLGCTDQQSPTQRLQEVLNQLSWAQKANAEGSEELAKIKQGYDTLLRDRDDLEKYRTFQQEVGRLINDSSIGTTDTYRKIEEKYNDLFTTAK